MLHCDVADGDVVLLDQQHLEAAAGGVAGDAGAVDAGTDDEKIVDRGALMAETSGRTSAFYASGLRRRSRLG